ncbi:MAG: hypothetical protein ACXABU_10770 [Candidatus Hodarchaeales archaeon]
MNYRLHKLFILRITYNNYPTKSEHKKEGIMDLIKMPDINVDLMKHISIRFVGF